jgi:transketolase
MGPYESALLGMADADDRLVVLTAENRAAIRGLPKALGDRFIDTGIAEQTLIGMGAGLALRGRIPILHALATFLTLRPFEFIRTDLGIAGLPAKLIGSVPGVLSEANGPTHQALEDVSLMRGIPGMRVFCPADLEDLLLGLPAVIADPSPWYVRYLDRPSVARHAPFVIGKAEVHRQGHDVGVLVYGALFREALESAQLLEAAGVSVRLLNLRTLKPLDEAAVLETVESTGLVVTIEDHFRVGGLYTILAELLLRERRTARVLPVAFDERWFVPAMLPDLLRAEGLTGPQLAERILLALNERS